MSVSQVRPTADTSRPSGPTSVSGVSSATISSLTGKIASGSELFSRLPKWPVATETVDPTDFQFTLNTGEVVFGHAAGMNPNWENNERSTVVLFG